MNHRDQQRVDIPKIYKSDLTGSLFDHCIHCERELLNGEVPYIIEKALKPYQGFKSYSTIFEYAMCLPCAVGLRSKISTESMARINEYFATNINLVERARTTSNAQEVEEYISHCMIKGAHIESMGECQIYAQCIGDQMLLGDFPYMLGSEVLEEVMGLLSAETLEQFNDLKDQLLDGPSEFHDLLQGGPKVLI